MQFLVALEHMYARMNTLSSAQRCSLRFGAPPSVYTALTVQNSLIIHAPLKQLLFFISYFGKLRVVASTNLGAWYLSISPNLTDSPACAASEIKNRYLE